MKVVYIDKTENRPNYKDLGWVEYSYLQLLDEEDGRLIRSNNLPQSIHMVPKSMRIDMLFIDHAQQVTPKRLYMLAVSKGLIPSVINTPMGNNANHGALEPKGLLVSIQGTLENPQQMRDFLMSSEVREIIPTDGIATMLLELNNLPVSSPPPTPELQ